MSNIQFGFIGCGNMGSALASAVAKTVTSDEILLSDKSEIKAKSLSRALNCNTGDNYTIASYSKFIFLGVKPQMMKDTLSEISEVLSHRNDRFVLVSMAAGVEISTLEKMLGIKYPIIRIMPNTPVSAGKGMILYTYNENVFMDEISQFCEALKFAGRLDKIDEAMIDAASAVSGCGPAFVYLFAEALADAGVECGLPRIKAQEYAAQTLAGAAELLLTSGKHAGQLKDEVCSPGGSTIAGVHALESSNFKAAAMDAVVSAFNRTKELGK